MHHSLARDVYRHHIQILNIVKPNISYVAKCESFQVVGLGLIVIIHLYHQCLLYKHLHSKTNDEILEVR